MLCDLISCHITYHVLCHILCVMSHVTCHVSYHVSWHKSCDVKYHETHILVLNNNINFLTILSNVMYTCQKSCIHVTSHLPMSQVMYPCHKSCIHVTCHVSISHVTFMSHSNSHIISFYKSEYWITLDNMW